jgi:hypothetical protein
MTSVVDIYNKALGIVGAQGKLTTDSQNTREAEVCNLYYEDVLTAVFSSAYWGSLKATTSLTLRVERDFNLGWTDADPAPNWRYAYALPEGFVYPRWLSSFSPFAMSALGDETTLQTDEYQAILTYTKMLEDPNRWEPLLRNMVVAALADAVARPLRVDDSQYRRVALFFEQTYQSVLTLQANAEVQPQMESVPDWITIRAGGFTPATPVQFLYPSQVLAHGYGQIQLQRR